MATQGTSSSPINNPARFSGQEPGTLRKPVKLLGVGQSFCLLPLGQELAASCINLARMMARPYKDREPHLADDYEGEAILSLTRAAAYYDPNRGFSFTTFASNCIKRACQDFRRRSRLSGYRTATEDSPVVGTLLGNETSPDEPTARVAEKDLTEIVGTVMAKMQPRLAEVLRRRFYDDQTLQEIGDDLGITKERVRQLETKALLFIRESGIAG